ncbi:MAG TPA: CDP-diacylglycerol--serine O-phosphatidyltransferase [Bacteroidales bacterium]|jgi:CDP-diacylglycerol--serine O-phosphatidyltransferase|nr:CDP-diacylglycerol--serine O-phosphatidyltransferase [Bacteroidales bacterium]
MKKQIPNFITSLNLFTGSIGVVFALRGFLEIASLLILLCAVFDFLDGFTSRLLNAKSPYGVDLDSLADIISFGLLPATILFAFMENSVQNIEPSLRDGLLRFSPYIAFIIPVFSAYRLAIFNHDETQRFDFKGLPTPANALFIGFLHFAALDITALNNIGVLIGLTILFSFLLVTRLPMFSLKFYHWEIEGNITRYSFLFLSLILLLIFRLGAFPIIILSYLLISVAILAFKKR